MEYFYVFQTLMHWLKTALFFLIAGMVVGCASRDLPRDPALVAERKGITFLSREVPAWRKDNGCFSCHNNGDAARALYLASQKGYRIPAPVLAATTAWVTHPQRWDENKGDPGFSDKRLADLQFAASLLAAKSSDLIEDSSGMKLAATRLLSGQAADGSWPIEAKDTLGSPATYGAPLATHIAVLVLSQIDSAEAHSAKAKAEQWLRTQVPVNTVLNASTLLMALQDVQDADAETKRQQCLQFIRRAQTSDSAWGPYANSPSEVFDTAMVLLALAPMRANPDIAALIQSGRSYLAANQYDDGSWPETTRPSGGESYAQRLSTTGWAVQALLQTRD